MTARFLDGARVGGEIREEVKQQVTALREAGVVPGLAAILVGDNPASEIYVRSKTRACGEAGIHSETLRLPASTTTAGLIEQIEILNRRPDIDAILVQLPLPSPIETSEVLARVRPEKDVDGFHPQNVGRLVQGRPTLVPCTPAGILELLRREKVPLVGARAVVIGRSDIVGKPMALLLLHQHATVTICHSRTRDLAGVAATADLLVAAMGKAALVRGDFIKPGAVVVDVGMNRVERPAEVRDYFGDDAARLEQLEKKGYTLVGDVHPREARHVAGALTPVPGGVGPLTIAMLLANTVKAARALRG
jgi:methylenetetrahydrofolate dehydrogenase (NADP+)/methenyltetrahydrofolate cyclohydrolase